MDMDKAAADEATAEGVEEGVDPDDELYATAPRRPVSGSGAAPCPSVPH